MSVQKRIAVIGAGIAGLTVARSLHDMAEVVVFEKSRRLGGRLASQRIGDASFDHGAQYFTIRDPAFHSELEPAIENGTVEAWSGPIGRCKEGHDIAEIISPEPRFVGTPAMTALPKWLARKLVIYHERKVEMITGTSGKWHITTANTSFGPFDWVIVSCPAPQAIDIMPRTFQPFENLATARMNACFTVIINLNHRVQQRYSGLRCDDEVIGWVTECSSRPQRPSMPALVVHSQNRWADVMIDESPERVRTAMLDRLDHFLPGTALSVVSAEIKRWRFANVETPADGDPLVDVNSGLAACGDWTIGNRVEAAFMSAKKVAQVVKAEL